MLWIYKAFIWIAISHFFASSLYSLHFLVDFWLIKYKRNRTITILWIAAASVLFNFFCEREQQFGVFGCNIKQHTDWDLLWRMMFWLSEEFAGGWVPLREILEKQAYGCWMFAETQPDLLLWIYCFLYGFTTTRWAVVTALCGSLATKMSDGREWKASWNFTREAFACLRSIDMKRQTQCFLFLL